MALSDEPDLQWRESGAARGRAARPCRKRSATSAFYASGDAAWEVIKDERAARTLAANADRDAANAARDASWALGTWREFARQAAAFDYVDAWDAPAACADDDEARVVRQWASEDVEAFGRDADGAPPQRGPLRVWGREVGDAGQRVYVAAHWARFLKAYADAGDKHYYELIREGARPRAYFDLEFGVLENPGLDGAALTEKWLERFGSAVEAEFFEATPLFADHARCAAEEGLYLACPDLDAQLRGNLAEEPGAAALEALQAAVEAAAGEVSADGVAAALRLKVVSHVLALARRRAAGEAFLVVDWRKQVVQLDATTARKFSRHAIWTLPDGAVFADAAALGRLVKRVARQDLAFDVRDRGTGACFVDCAVYTRNRLFRLARSTKRGKHAPLLLVDTNARLATAKDLLPEASLVVPLWCAPCGAARGDAKRPGSRAHRRACSARSTTPRPTARRRPAAATAAPRGALRLATRSLGRRDATCCPRAGCRRRSAPHWTTPCWPCGRGARCASGSASPAPYRARVWCGTTSPGTASARTSGANTSRTTSSSTSTFPRRRGSRRATIRPAPGSVARCGRSPNLRPKPSSTYSLARQPQTPKGGVWVND
ncbi:hypothetical protein M885DRAFT_230235 [Pelagophyceae sp. CCMP2097]|nr:hypothetical protein M885DRAFT_230235 [Pelagophyceae sp. CCMP2097]